MSSGGFRKGTVYSKILKLTSSERSSGTAENFIFTTGDNLRNVSQVSVQSVIFHNNIYNVWQDTATERNNLITLQANVYPGNVPNSQDFTIPVGYYNVTDLMDLIIGQWNTLFSATHGTVSYSLNDKSNKITLSYNDNKTAQSGAFFLKPANTSDWIFEYLGWDNYTGVMTTAYPNSTTNPTTAPGMPKMSGPTTVYIRSQTLAPGNAFEEKGRLSNTLVSVPVTAPFLGLNVMECKVDALCEVLYGKPREINYIDIQLCDRSGRVLPLNGGSLTVELRVWFNIY